VIGIVGKKCGMTRVFTDDGRSVPVTIVQASPNLINRIKTEATDGYNAIQVLTGQATKNPKKPDAGQIKANPNEKFSHRLHEFRLNENELEQVDTGKEITVDYFEKGELVDVTGNSIGKGYAGVIKRHNFKTQDATHGNSLAHRAPGSIGQNQTPGRVFKGKKMAGRMGNVKKTIQNLEVIDIDIERNLIFIKGSIAGHDNSFVIVTPSIKSKHEEREIFKTPIEDQTPEVEAQPEEAPETEETPEVEAQPEEAPETEETPEVEAQPEEAPETEETPEVEAEENFEEDKTQ
jgi:large subunit ribosomal protein L3